MHPPPEHSVSSFGFRISFGLGYFVIRISNFHHFTTAQNLLFSPSETSAPQTVDSPPRPGIDRDEVSTLREIGDEVGGLDYTAVAMAIKRFENKAVKQDGLRELMKRVRVKCEM